MKSLGIVPLKSTGILLQLPTFYNFATLGSFFSSFAPISLLRNHSRQTNLSANTSRTATCTTLTDPLSRCLLLVRLGPCVLV
jgi:hypothetical protein